MEYLSVGTSHYDYGENHNHHDYHHRPHLGVDRILVGEHGFCQEYSEDVERVLEADLVRHAPPEQSTAAVEQR
jgi:hypothetical protein